MKKSRFTAEQMVSILRETDRSPVAEVALLLDSDLSLLQAAVLPDEVLREQVLAVLRPALGSALFAQHFPRGSSEPLSDPRSRYSQRTPGR
jgi:hypothetical protein